MGRRAMQVGWGLLAGALAVLAFSPTSTGWPRAEIATRSRSPRPIPDIVTTMPTVPSEPDPEPEATPPASVPAAPSVWAAIAECEPDTGHGRLNWLQRIWDRHRGDAPEDPAQASWEQEVAAGERLLAETDGRYTAWPECAQRLGLPR